MGKNKKKMYVFIGGLVQRAKDGDTEAAAALLHEAATHLCDKTDDGERLRVYIQECLKKIEYKFFCEVFPTKSIIGKKTAFFDAFNLGKPNHPPKDRRKAERNRNLTCDYILLIALGKNPSYAISDIQEKYFPDNRDKDLVKENSAIYSIIKKTKIEALGYACTRAFFDELTLAPYLPLIQFIYEMESGLIYYDAERRERIGSYLAITFAPYGKTKIESVKNYDSTKPILSNLSIALKKELKKETKKNNAFVKNSISLLAQAMKEMKRCSPVFGAGINQAQSLQKLFNKTDIRKTSLTEIERKSLGNLLRLFLK